MANKEQEPQDSWQEVDEQAWIIDLISNIEQLQALGDQYYERANSLNELIQKYYRGKQLGLKVTCVWDENQNAFGVFVDQKNKIGFKTPQS